MRVSLKGDVNKEFALTKHCIKQTSVRQPVMESVLKIVWA